MRLRVVPLCLALAATCLGGAAAPRPVANQRCPEPALSGNFDPGDLESVRKHLGTAPRIVLAMGLDRHDQLRELLDRGENPNVCVLGSSVLALAAASGDTEEVEILLDGGASLEAPKDSEGGTAFLMALGLGRYDVARLLMARGADVLAAADGNRNALFEIATSVPSPGFREARLELAETLLARGVALNVPVGAARTTPLMMAAIRGDLELVQLFLQHGADASLQDRHGTTALAFAQRKGHARIAELISTAAAAPGGAPSSAAR